MSDDVIAPLDVVRSRHGVGIVLLIGTEIALYTIGEGLRWDYEENIKKIDIEKEPHNETYVKIKEIEKLKNIRSDDNCWGVFHRHFDASELISIIEFVFTKHAYNGDIYSAISAVPRSRGRKYYEIP